jgi:hypothetical protein
MVSPALCSILGPTLESCHIIRINSIDVFCLVLFMSAADDDVLDGVEDGGGHPIAGTGSGSGSS